MTSGEPFRRIDYCDHALAVVATGQLPPWETVRACPVCLRRWRIAEARRHGWTPLPRVAARALLDRMAEALANGREPADDQTRRGFYAALATAPDDEADFAAAIAAARRAAAEEPTPPANPGWRAIFADLTPVAPTPEPDRITRVWQWRTAGATLAGEGRTFIRGEEPPPFLPAPPDTTRAGRWLREGTRADARPIQRQILGPLLLTILADDTADTLRLTLRLREHALAEPVPTRIHLGHEVLNAPLDPIWSGVLSEERLELTLPLQRADLAAFAIEIDTAW